MTPHECILACFSLASSGHLDEARENLRRNRPCLETEEGLDLLARIELRLGNEAEARRLWTQAIETGIGGRFSRRALDALDSVAWRHRRLIRNLRRGFAIGIPAFIGLFVGLLVRCSSEPGSQTESVLSEQQQHSKSIVESGLLSAVQSTVELEPAPEPDLLFQSKHLSETKTDTETEPEPGTQTALEPEQTSLDVQMNETTTNEARSGNK